MSKVCVVTYEYNNYDIQWGIKGNLTLMGVFVVWQVKVLQNYKALLATDIKDDQHYYEVTYNGDKKELYLDVYNKQENKCFEVE